MEEIFLEADARADVGKGKVKNLRKTGLIPGVVYGQDKEPLIVKVLQRDLMRLIHERRIEGVVINLKIKDDKKNKPRACLIKEIQHDPVSDNIIHVDFNEISLTKVIKVGVPVTTKGEAPGVKHDGGALEHILWEIEVECLPTDIPKEIEVDISQLKIGDSIHIKDISFPSNVKVIASTDSIVLSVAAPMKEEVAAPVEGEEKAEPEVIKEKKEVPGEGKEEEGKEKEKK
jgi:large subunit ribosomal protein L25